MNVLPGKTIKGIWILALITLVLVLVMFLNTYAGPARMPIFGFLKKGSADAEAAA